VQIECVFFGPLREATGTKTVAVEPEAETVGGLLAELERTYPDLAGRLRDGEGIADEVVVTLNGRHVQHETGLETTVSDGDVIRLTTAVYGG
jgi:molybdopterin synthase sulfur carrier subunit